MPTSSVFSSSPTTTIQNIQTAVGPQVHAIGQSASSFYFSYLTIFEVVSVLITVAFVIGIIMVAIKTGWATLRMDRFQNVVLQKDTAKMHVKESWEDIERHFFAGNDNDLKIAIIEADTLIGEALRIVGIQGAQLGDRLKKVKLAQLPNVEDVWQAHKLRNRIAHETDFVMKRDLAERALTVYEKALQYLGMLGTEEGFKNPDPAPTEPPPRSPH